MDQTDQCTIKSERQETGREEQEVEYSDASCDSRLDSELVTIQGGPEERAKQAEEYGEDCQLQQERPAVVSQADAKGIGDDLPDAQGTASWMFG
ncbi:hypothetical protein ACETRX_12045 [Labrys portucalensis]|uniref:Uncharacterized protein n=1 Tax=Labrys neptuniae TaxID=376174 RepID=A0ABV6ZDZ7_9HYPH